MKRRLSSSARRGVLRDGTPSEKAFLAERERFLCTASKPARMWKTRWFPVECMWENGWDSEHTGVVRVLSRCGAAAGSKLIGGRFPVSENVGRPLAFFWSLN